MIELSPLRSAISRFDLCDKSIGLSVALRAVVIYIEDINKVYLQTSQPRLSKIARLVHISLFLPEYLKTVDPSR